MLAQITEATQAGSELMRTAGQYNAETFLAVLIVVAVMVVIVLLIWKMAIPYWAMKMDLDRQAAQSAQENSTQLSHAVATCLPVISSTHEAVTRTREVTDSTEEIVQRMQMVLRVGVCAIEKIASKSEVDVSNELSRIHGILQPAEPRGRT